MPFPRFKGGPFNKSQQSLKKLKDEKSKSAV